MFSLLPAIDLTAGRLGAYASSGPSPVDAFDGDPLLAAETFVAAGAEWLHVVDMDLAFDGVVTNAGSVASLHETFPGVSIQVSGGIRAPEHAAAFAAAGATRVVIGSAALGHGRGFDEVASATAGKYLVGIEVDGRQDPVTGP